MGLVNYHCYVRTSNKNTNSACNARVGELVIPVRQDTEAILPAVSSGRTISADRIALLEIGNGRGKRRCGQGQ